MESMLEAVHTPMKSRSLSPDTSDGDSESDCATLCNPSPAPSPSPRLRATRARLARKGSAMTMFSPAPTPLAEYISSPAPSSFSTSSSMVKVKREKKYKVPTKGKKRSGGCKRDPIKRDDQNREAQQTYRNKVKDSATLVCHGIRGQVELIYRWETPVSRSKSLICSTETRLQMSS